MEVGSYLFVYYLFHRNISSSITSCLSLLLIYWTCINLLSHFPLKGLPNLAFVCCVPSYLCHDFNLIGIIIIIIIIIIIKVVVMRAHLGELLHSKRKWHHFRFGTRNDLAKTLLFLLLVSPDVTRRARRVALHLSAQKSLV